MYIFTKVDRGEISLYIAGYYNSLMSQANYMWEEEVINKSDVYKIEEDGETVGFFAINKENVLTQLYIIDIEHEDVLSLIIKKYYVYEGYVSSYDLIFKAISDKFKKASIVMTDLEVKNECNVSCESEGESISNHKVYKVWF